MKFYLGGKFLLLGNIKFIGRNINTVGTLAKARKLFVFRPLLLVLGARRFLLGVKILLLNAFYNLAERNTVSEKTSYKKVLFIPNFNIADLCICIGWILIVVFLIIYTKKEDVLKTEK